MDILTLIWLNGFVAVVLLFFIAYILVKKKEIPQNGNDEDGKQKLHDTLLKITNQLEKTV